MQAAGIAIACTVVVGEGAPCVGVRGRVAKKENVRGHAGEKHGPQRRRVVDGLGHHENHILIDTA